MPIFTMKTAICLITLCYLGLSLAANDYYVTGRPILQLASVGGFVDVARLHNQIPEVKIWEDGTTIFTIDDQGVRKVQYAHMRPTDVKNLVDKIVASGFLQFQNLYSAKDAPADLPSTCIKFWTSKTNSKQVCEYLDGAPEFFHHLITYLRELKTRVKDPKPFYPAAGYVRAYHVSCEGTSCSNLAIYTGPRLSTTTGIWITDTNVLRKLWDAVNNNKILTDSPNSYIRVSVQVEDLSILEPPPRYKEDPNKPSTTYNNNNVVIVRAFTAGVLGFAFLIGLAFFIRGIRHRKTNKQTQDNEIPLVESSFENNSTQEPSSQQWTAPAYTTTTPQYIVYYVQPTQTVQY